MVAVIVPAVTARRLSDSGDLEIALEMYKKDPRCARSSRSGDSGVRLSILPRHAGARANHQRDVNRGVQRDHEKQARTLEPLLVTPITTLELLCGKLLGALLPALLRRRDLARAVSGRRRGRCRARRVPRPARTAHARGRPVDWPARLDGRLTAGDLRVVTRQRLEDRAQQLGIFVILPIPALLLGQMFGGIELTGP
jgi:hypothetical protein